MLQRAALAPGSRLHVFADSKGRSCYMRVCRHTAAAPRRLHVLCEHLGRLLRRVLATAHVELVATSSMSRAQLRAWSWLTNPPQP